MCMFFEVGRATWHMIGLFAVCWNLVFHFIIAIIPLQTASKRAKKRWRCVSLYVCVCYEREFGEKSNLLGYGEERKRGGVWKVGCYDTLDPVAKCWVLLDHVHRYLNKRIER